MAMPARLTALSTPAVTHAGTSEVVVTIAAGAFFPSTKRLPSAFSSRASFTSVFDSAAHAGSVGNSAGLAVAVYCSGLVRGARALGGEHAARTMTAATVRTVVASG